MRHFQSTAGRQNNVVGQVHQADGVGAEDAHAARRLHQLRLTARTCFASFGVAAGQHDGCSRSAFCKFTHGDMGPLSTEQDDGDVGHGRQRCDIRIAMQAVDVVDARVHRINLAGEAMLAEIGHRSARCFAGIR